MEFPPTFWTVIRQAGTDPRGAREQVVRRYWKPIYEYLRIRGLSHEDAEDLTQAVFLQVCRDDFLERADRSRGKFRTLLLAVANHVLNSDWRRAYAEKRAGDRAAVPIDTSILELPDRHTPSSPDFDRAWAQNLISEALTRLGSPHRDAIEQLYLANRTYVEIAATLGKNEGDVKNLIYRGKARLREVIRELVSEYAGAHVESEMEDLKAFLG